MIGLYIHIPFCREKCPYCDFFTVSKFGAISASSDRGVNGIDHANGINGVNGKFGAINDEFKTLSTKYINKLIDEIHTYEPGVKIDTIYIGGGTPSMLDVQLLDKLISAVYAHFDVNLTEFTIEINPESMQFLAEYKSLGINRVSVGVQSFDDKTLVQFGRGHDSAKAISAIKTAGEHFDNVSCDLLLYENSMQNDIMQIAELKNIVTHVSMYILKSPKFKLDDDSVAEYYTEAVELLNDNGFSQYEISNFGRKSLHNLKYWHCDEYIGIGAAASSLYGGMRYKNSNSVDYKRIIEDENPCGEFEKAMLQLRLTEGLELNDNIKAKSEMLVKNGLAKINGNRLCLTPKGFLVQNQVILYLYSDKI